MSRIEHAYRQKSLIHQLAIREAKGRYGGFLIGIYRSAIEWILASTLSKLTFLVSIALFTRAIHFFQNQVIANDGVFYIQLAKLFSEGKYEQIPFSFNLYPFLLIPIHGLVGDWELSGRLVSITFSTLAVIPIFLLGRSLYDEKVGWFASIFYLFLPNSLRYSSEVLRDPAAWFFLVLTLWLAWIGAQKNRSILFGAASMSAGLGSMIRAESLALWSILILFIAFRKREGISFKRRSFNVALFMLVFPIVFSGFLFFMNNHSSQKGFNALHLYPLFFLKNYTSISLQSQDHIGAIGDKVYKSLPFASKNFIELASSHRIILNASEVVYKFVKSANLLIILILFGLWKRKKQGFELADWYLFCSWATLFGISIAYAMQVNYFSTRHGLTLVIPGLFFAGHGLIYAAEILSVRTGRFSPKWAPVKKHLLPILASLMIFVFIIQALPADRVDRIPMKKIGLGLKEKGYHGSTIMGPARLSRLVFYADGRFIEMPDSWENVAQSIRRDGVRFIVVDVKRIGKDCPGFSENWSRAGLTPFEVPGGGIDKSEIQIYRTP